MSSSSTNTYYYHDDDDDDDGGNDGSSSSPSISQEEQEMVKAQLYGLTGSDAAHTRLQNQLSERLTRLAQLQDGSGTDTDTDTDTDVTNAMRDVAETQSKLGMLDDAQNLQEQILSRLVALHAPTPTSPPPDHTEVARTMHAIGSLQTRLEQYAGSQRWLEAALEMERRLHGVGYRRPIGRTLNALALLHVRFASAEGRDRFDDGAVAVTLELMAEAEAHFRYHGTDGPAHVMGPVDDDDDGSWDASDGGGVGGGAHGETDGAGRAADHPDLASICENMAMLYRTQRNYPRALEKYEEALQIKERLAAAIQGGDAIASAATSEDRSKIVSLNMDIGDCVGGSQGGLKRYKDALERYQRALDVHAALVRSERTTSLAHEPQSDGAAGERPTAPTTDVVPTNTQFPGEVGTSVEGVLRHNIGTMHARLNSHDSALEEYETALAIKKSLVGEDHPEVAVTLNAIGALMAGDESGGRKALAYFREALRIFRIHSSSSSVGGGDGDAVWAAGDGDEADEHAAKTLTNIQLLEKNLMQHGMGDTATSRW